MAEITKVGNLRPELLDMSVAELLRRRTEIDMAIEEKSKAEEAEKRSKLVSEAGAHVDQLLESLRWLEENKFLGETVVQFFSTERGGFMPHLKVKKPRA